MCVVLQTTVIFIIFFLLIFSKCLHHLYVLFIFLLFSQYNCVHDSEWLKIELSFPSSCRYYSFFMHSFYICGEMRIFSSFQLIKDWTLEKRKKIQKLFVSFHRGVCVWICMYANQLGSLLRKIFLTSENSHFIIACECFQK